MTPNFMVVHFIPISMTKSNLSRIFSIIILIFVSILIRIYHMIPKTNIQTTTNGKLCKPKYLEKEWSFGLKSVSKMSQRFFYAYSNLEYKFCKAKITSSFKVHKRTEYRCDVSTRNKAILRDYDNEIDLNFGLIGSGFMGRTHAFGISIANRVFDLPYNLHLKKIADVFD